MNALLPALGTVSILVGAVYLFGRWILGPIDRAAKRRRAPVRFSISDFLCLFVAVQLPLTVVSRLQSEDTAPFFWAFTILAWVIAPVIWVACAISLSRAGIASGKHRFLFMGIVLPIVYYGLTPFVGLTAIGVGTLLFDSPVVLFRSWWPVPAWALIGAALVGCGLYTNWLAQHSSAERATSTADLEPQTEA